ncbi:MAG: alpha/beta hydrolase family protein [Planctomycetia bacterium]|nr:alpha/beta hydrolase family protein [Planctomycetia bacterium]
MNRAALTALLLLLAAGGGANRLARSAEDEVRRGEIDFQPKGSQDNIPERFRLAAHKFPFEQRPAECVSDKISLSTVTFPSPVETPHKENNHCEYFRPAGDGKQKYPAVVVLHILGGDFDLCRLFSRTFAHNGVCALFLKMPYYGPRRPPGVSKRMISVDPRETVEGMTQAVLDIRRAAAWLAAQEEVDPERIGIFGISLGGITASLATTAEPRFTSAAFMLAGGDIGSATWDAPEGKAEPEIQRAKRFWLEQGRTREEYLETLLPVDPVRYGENVRGRRLLMLNAQYDEVIPRRCTDALWKSFGEPEIVWYDGGHYTSARFLFEALGRVTNFFNGDAKASGERSTAAGN